MRKNTAILFYPFDIQGDTPKFICRKLQSVILNRMTKNLLSLNANS